jgi:hypothetical protein
VKALKEHRFPIFRNRFVFQETIMQLRKIAHRVLSPLFVTIPFLIAAVAPFTVASAQDATIIGQPDASSNAPGHNAAGLNFPLGIDVDPEGGVYIADRNNHRILYYAPDGDQIADRVYGQHGNMETYIVNFDGAAGSGAPSENTLANPTYAALDSADGLYVADRDNHRVLYYAADGDTTADRVYGQFGSFILNVVNNDGSGLISGVGIPDDDNLGVYALTIALDPDDGLYIADSSNHRVLYYAADGDTTADRVYGQYDNMNSAVKNNDGSGNSGTPTADNLNFPRGIAFDSTGGIYIADRDNNRVLYFEPDGDTTADRVMGQFDDLSTNVPNNDGSGVSGDPSATNFTSPRALVIDGADGLYIADSGNNRVLYFAPDGDDTADLVFGQFGSFTTGVPNNDGSGTTGQPSAANMFGVQGLALHRGQLYVSDTNNNRILVIEIQF